MSYIKAKMTQENLFRKNKYVHRIPYVVESDHPRFVEGSRFDWGFVSVALDNGYSVTIEPFYVNQQNCAHYEGFHRSGLIRDSHLGRIALYHCNECGLSREIYDSGDLPSDIPADYEWVNFGRDEIKPIAQQKNIKPISTRIISFIKHIIKME